MTITNERRKEELAEIWEDVILDVMERALEEKFGEMFKATLNLALPTRHEFKDAIKAGIQATFPEPDLICDAIRQGVREASRGQIK